KMSSKQFKCKSKIPPEAINYLKIFVGSRANDIFSLSMCKIDMAKSTKLSIRPEIYDIECINLLRFDINQASFPSIPKMPKNLKKISDKKKALEQQLDILEKNYK
ncbi:MAG: hypothetical protein MHPSP_002790, partial [Paramarteilia canceri]